MRGCILDTNVVSEQRRARPHPNVASWLHDQDPERLFLTATIVGELAVGIACLPSGKRRIELEAWLDTLIRQRFADRILPYDTRAGLSYGELAADARMRGWSPDLSDAQIAAVARVHDMAVATRNIAHFEHLGVAVINPWDAG
jgi:toxin FitB